MNDARSDNNEKSGGHEPETDGIMESYERILDTAAEFFDHLGDG